PEQPGDAMANRRSCRRRLPEQPQLGPLQVSAVVPVRQQYRLDAEIFRRRYRKGIEYGIDSDWPSVQPLREVSVQCPPLSCIDQHSLVDQQLAAAVARPVVQREPVQIDWLIPLGADCSGREAWHD